MKLRITLILVIAIAVLGSIYAFKSFQTKKMMEAMASMAPPPPTVACMPALGAKWTSALSAVATLQSKESITLSTEVPGVIRRIAFESGIEVKAGDLLLELDSSYEQPQLEGLEAAARLSALSLQRAVDLRAKGTNAQSDLDAADALNTQAQAAVNQLKSMMAKKRIVAPFAGRVGIRKVSTGAYLAPGDPIVMLENSNPIYADFNLPQSELGLVSVGLGVTLKVDSYPDREFSGKVEAINPRINEATRSVTVRAVFENADAALKGGMFGNALLGLRDTAEVIVIPSAALVYSSYGNFVYVVELGPQGTGKVTQQFVVLGAKRGDQVAVSKGLKVGDQVVTAGQLKLRNGIPVRINNSIQPDNNPAPKPNES
jgi:membrane fusion protein (multidrug efflux system)